MEINKIENKKIEGLKFVPTIGTQEDDLDWFPVENITESRHFTPCVASTFTDIFSRVKDECKSIFESIDTEVFESEKYCQGNDFGIGAMWYK